MSKLRTALAYGADAVYVGAAGFSMRPKAASFTPEVLAEALAHTRRCGKKLYVAMNSMLFDEDFDLLANWLEQTRNLPFDALIIADPGAFDLAREIRPELKLHVSTQLNSANARSAAFWKRAGAERIVLARECSLEQARIIAEQSGMDVEVFIHGAMCVAVSGRCLLSAHLCGQSASRGVCKQSCRWEWEVVEKNRPDAPMSVVETDRETIFFGSTDLCLIQHIPELFKSGAMSFKIEGRMKSEFYVATVVRVYRAALDRYAADPENYVYDPTWMEELESVSHRPYATGFAFGYPDKEPQTLQTDSRPVSTCETLGFIHQSNGDRYTVSAKHIFSPGDEIEWIGPDMRGGSVTVAHLVNAKGKPIEKTHCGADAVVEFEGNPHLPEHAILRRRT
ncbi:MAG: U32 family peptidase [Verrucomicrobia bacterium]|nr:U32 family peptidase [Verrucomicrobiota bacterium]